MSDVEDRPQIIDVKIEDLLNRDEIKLDDTRIKGFIQGEVVLVTGGGGSIGSELCRQIADLEPKQLIIFDIYENNAYDIQQELLRKFSKAHKKLNLKVLIGSVYNRERLESVFKAYQPTIVFHAAAYKHVPLMEDSAVEAVRTNVIGTYNTSSLANQYNVKKFVLVSSDKAVRSTNVMGATKRYAELIVQEQQEHSSVTKFSAVRFGNVLGSNGSVIPLFKKQIADGGPVTVTHQDITRYFMTIPEAVGLILQCGVYANGGEVFILDMGEPVKIKDLAEKMISLTGLKPYEDIKIEFTGLRPGEKLFEELLVDHDHDNQHKTENQKIYIEKQKVVEKDELELNQIIETIEQLDNEEIKAFVGSVIKTYKRNGETS
jgi:FlaA1/EpsC-like NDP-sugar epimerase